MSTYNEFFAEYRKLPHPYRKKLVKRTSTATPYLYTAIVENGFKNVLEIGTFKGRNTLFMAKALEQTGGKITSIDINGADQEVAKGLLGKFDLENGTFLTGDSLEVLRSLSPDEPWDMVFIDGHHSYEYSRGEYVEVRGNMASNGLIIFDDVSSVHPDSKGDGGVPRTVKELGIPVLKVDRTRIAVLTYGDAKFEFEGISTRAPGPGEVDTDKLGGWAISSNTFKKIREILPDGSSIIECGSGLGSNELAKFYDVTSIEHNSKWWDKFDTIRYIKAPIQNKWYNRDRVARGIGAEKFDMLIIDGPPQRIGREGILGSFGLFNDPPIVIVDDAQNARPMKLAQNIAERYGYEQEVCRFEDKTFVVLRKMP